MIGQELTTIILNLFQRMETTRQSILTKANHLPPVNSSNNPLRRAKSPCDKGQNFYKVEDFRSFLSHFSLLAQIHPSKNAIEFHQESITYADLDQLSGQLASYLLAKYPAGKGIFAISMERSIDMIVGILGILKAGHGYLPVDPKLPADRIKYMLSNASAVGILTSKSLSSSLPGNAPHLLMDEVKPVLSQYPECPKLAPIEADDLAYVLFTSGSTGKPKGVQISHKNLINLLLSMQKAPGMTESDRLLAITTISFDISVLEMFLPLISGATIVLADAEAIKDARALLKLLKSSKITFMQATPVTWRMLTAAGWDQSLALRALSGGEAFPSDLAHTMLSLCDEVWNGYGPTETTIYSTIKKLDAKDNKITIGQGIDNTGIYILDENGNEVEPGQSGEIYISGDGVSVGYLGREDLTVERFLANPFEMDRPIMYRTGDLGRELLNGDIECLGRADHQVKIRGFRIELGEIEQLLLQEKEIAAVAVNPWEDRPGNKRLAAFIVPKNSLQQSEFLQMAAQWKELLKQQLPEYMIPADWVMLAELPLTANNKIDRKALPVPEKTSSFASANGAEPQTEMEKLLFEVWKKSLRMDTFSVDDNFFDLGGHSILAVEVMTQVDQLTGINLPLTSLFSHPTLREFAAYLDEQQLSGKSAEWKSLVPVKTTGSKTPIYLVHGMAANAGTFFKLPSLLDPERPIYGFQSKGLNGSDTPLETVEEMAVHYTNELLEQQPEGPYLLGGYSFGGYVAYEMARILIEKGLEVKELYMFDTQAVNMPMNAHKNDSSLNHWMDKLRKKKVELQVLIQAPKTMGQFKLRAAARKKDKILEKLKLKVKSAPDGRAAVINKIRNLNFEAMVNYAPKPLEVKIIVFKARIIPSKSLNHPSNGWSDYSKSVEVIPVQGDHFTLFEDPFVLDLGKKLDHLLKESV